MIVNDNNIITFLGKVTKVCSDTDKNMSVVGTQNRSQELRSICTNC